MSLVSSISALATRIATELKTKAGLTATQSFTGTNTFNNATGVKVTAGVLYLNPNGDTAGSLVSVGTGRAQIVSTSSSIVPITAKGATSQTADLQQWQNSSASVLAKVDASGNVTGASFVKSGGTSAQFLKADGSVDSTSYSPANATVTDKSAGYTIQASDANTIIRSTGSAITITLANVLTVGQRIDFGQYGTGQITFAASGVTLNSKSNLVKTASQYSAASVICVASGVYWLVGDLA